METATKAEPFKMNPETGELPSCATCGAMPYYLARVNGADLYYCAHHATKYEERLLAASHGDVYDRRYLLTPSVN